MLIFIGHDISEFFLRAKTALVNAVGYAGLSVAAFPDFLLFYEAIWFKALVAISGLTLGLITSYAMILEVRIKKNKLKDSDKKVED